MSKGFYYGMQFTAYDPVLTLEQLKRLARTIKTSEMPQYTARKHNTYITKKIKRINNLKRGSYEQKKRGGINL